MPNLEPIAALDQILATLTQQWHDHRDALAKIEVVFAKYGIDPSKAHPVAIKATPVAAKPATMAAASAVKKGRRRKFATSGTDFVLGLLAGGKVLSTAQISAEWVKADRPGKADQALSFLTRNRKIKREPIKDGRGSKYTIL